MDFKCRLKEVMMAFFKFAQFASLAPPGGSEAEVFKPKPDLNVISVTQCPTLSCISEKGAEPCF